MNRFKIRPLVSPLRAEQRQQGDLWCDGYRREQHRAVFVYRTDGRWLCWACTLEYGREVYPARAKVVR